MKFILISRHTNGAEIPDNERERNLQEMREWIASLNPTLAMFPEISLSQAATEKISEKL